jgi:hypothetical protein
MITNVIYYECNPLSIPKSNPRRPIIALGQSTDKPDMHSPVKTVYVDWSGGTQSSLASLEVRLGIFAATLWTIIGFFGDTGAAFAVVQKDAPVARTVGQGVIVLSLTMRVIFLVLVWASLRVKNQPFGPAVVSSQRRLPYILRPLVSLLWLFQFFLGVAFVLVIEGFIHDPKSEIPARLWFMKALISLACVYATYLYLMLAIGTLVRNQGLLRFLWRGRFIFDLIITGVVLRYCS